MRKTYKLYVSLLFPKKEHYLREREKNNTRKEVIPEQVQPSHRSLTPPHPTHTARALAAGSSFWL